MGLDYDRKAMDLAGTLADLPTDQRHLRLDALCGSDDLLKARVLTLLNELSGDTSAASASPKASNLAPSWFVDSTPQRRLDQIGQFKLLRRIGIGGMGEVFEAEQDRPRRHVALKLIHPQRMNRSMLRRFEFEAEVLGRLDHPGIARVFDAGTAPTDYGPQPYFAMELVRGQGLDHWMRLNKPPLQVRLRILISICEAVQHAHQHGVIHRDLKPSNILVNDDAQPKILDFGVARAVEGDTSLTSQGETQHTETGQVIGTLQYMSPEQAAGDVRNLDTRSDVYALGVIAYQLLADRLPYDVSDKLLPDALRIIREEEPTRLSTINRALRGDLETIVLKALAKEKEQRYSSSAELAADVKRYLDYEPIAARPPSAWYQISKFARRHKLMVAAAAVALVALAGGLVVASAGLLRAERARRSESQMRQKAETAGAIALKVNGFLSDLLASVDPSNSRGDKVLVIDVLNRASRQLSGSFPNEPLVEAALHQTIADSYKGLGQFDQALSHYRQAGDLYGRAHQSDSTEAITALNNVGDCLNLLGRCDESEALLRQALERYLKLRGPDDIKTLSLMNNLALALQGMNRLADAENLQRDVLTRSQRTLAPDDPQLAAAMNNLATTLSDAGRFPEAEPLFRTAWERDKHSRGEDHPDTLLDLHNLARVIAQQGRLDEAEPLLRSILQQVNRVLGEDHPRTITALNNLADVLDSMDRMEESAGLFREALARSRRTLGNDHPSTLMMLGNLGYVLQRQAKHSEAEPLLRELFEACRAGKLPAGEAAQCAAAYGLCLHKQGRYADAEPALNEALEMLRSSGWGKGARAREVLAALGDSAESTGRPDEAARWRSQLAEIARPGTTSSHPR